jgi:hypothetical protein
MFDFISEHKYLILFLKSELIKALFLQLKGKESADI